MDDTERIIKELAKVGIQINDVFDLVNTRESYEEAIPVLIDLVQTNFANNWIKEGVIRALTVKEAKGRANQVLLSEYKKIPKDKIDKSYGWTIGNAFTVIITKEDVDEVLSIVQNRDNGRSRQMFVEALGKIKSEKTVDVLIKLLDDDDVYAHAIYALGALKVLKAKGKIEPFLNHSKAFVRKEAKKALKKLDKS